MVELRSTKTVEKNYDIVYKAIFMCGLLTSTYVCLDARGYFYQIVKRMKKTQANVFIIIFI
jgi:hypothetical protein